MRNSELFEAIDSAVESGRILFTRGLGHQRPRAEDNAASDSSATTLARAIMGDRDALVFEGRRYRLTTTARASRLNVQDGYRAVGVIEVPTLLKRMAERIATTEEERARWAEAVALASKPGEREGLALLRYTPSDGAANRTTDQPATTPSQLRPKIAAEDWIEVEIVYEDGAAFPGNCVVELPGGRIAEGPPDQNGIVRLDGLTPGTCEVRFPDLDADAFDTA